MTQPASQPGEEVFLVAALGSGRTGISRFGPNRVKLVGELRRKPERGVQLSVIHGSLSEAKDSNLNEGKERGMKPLRVTRVMKGGNEEVEVAG